MADSASDAAAYLAEIVAAYSTVITVVTCNIAAAVLVFYDYALTFDQEVRIIWRAARFSSPALLFYVVRYAAFFSSILIVLDVTEWAGQNDLVQVSFAPPTSFQTLMTPRTECSCAFLIRLEMALSALLFLSAATFSALRAYAVCNRNRWALLATLALGLVYPAISIYTFTQSTAGVGSQIAKLMLYHRLMLGARTCTVVADLSVLGLTLLNTWSLRGNGSALGVKTTFSQTLMRSGTVYFLVISVVNIIGLALGKNEEVFPFRIQLTSLVLTLFSSLQLIEPMSTWTAAFTAIMTYRFMLDLHEVARSSAGSAITHGELPGISQAGQQDTLVFRISGGRPSVVSRMADDVSDIYGRSAAADGEPGEPDEWDEDADSSQLHGAGTLEDSR
ncbi:hypothetical protein VTO73DRAFT_10920 [Trametes versicolor]